MVQLAISGILSFSTKPLQIGIFVGISFSVVACLLMFATLFTFLFDRSLPSGWTTIVMLLLLFNGIQLFVIGVLGVYLGGIYEEVKSRPRYILEEEISYRE